MTLAYRCLPATRCRLLPILAIGLAVCIPASAAQGEDDVSASGPQNAVSISYPGVEPLSALLWTVPFLSDAPAVPYYALTLTYERKLTPHLAFSISLVPWFAYTYDLPGYYASGLVGGFAQWLSLDWHPFDSGLHGFFVGICLASEFIFADVNLNLPDIPGFFFDGIGAETGWEGTFGGNWDWLMVLGMTMGGTNELGSFRWGVGVSYLF